MRLRAILDLSTVRILLRLLDDGEARYTDLSKMISSRGTLSLSLKELEQDRLIQRRVVATRPIQTYYSLTDLGTTVGAELKAIANSLA